MHSLRQRAVDENENQPQRGTDRILAQGEDTWQSWHCNYTDTGRLCPAWGLVFKFNYKINNIGQKRRQSRRRRGHAHLQEPVRKGQSDRTIRGRVPGARVVQFTGESRLDWEAAAGENRAR